MSKHLIIPDVQAKDGHDFTFLNYIGQYIVDQQPDVVVQIGDFADMESLSSYDKGKKSFEGRRYIKDIEATKQAMDSLLSPLRQYNARNKKNKKKLYEPRMVLTLGNHEERITRAVNLSPELDGLMKYDDLPYDDWEVHPFLQPVIIDGVAYSHYFPTGVMGRPPATATAMVNKLHMSCIAGHQQGKQVAYGKRADGKSICAIVAGSYYLHDEDYMDQLSNRHWRGLLVLNDVKDGHFDEMFLSIEYLERKYSK